MSESETQEPRFRDVFDEGLFAAPSHDEPVTEVSRAEIGKLLAQPAIPAGAGVGATHGTRAPRFEGDTSELPAEACWALQELVAAPHMTDQARKHWPAVLRHEQQLRSRLNELGLVLEINRERGYAFTRQAEDPSPYSRTLLRARTLSLGASALALYLYNQFLLAPEDPVVEHDEILDHMAVYRRPTDTDDVDFRRRTNAAITSLEDAAILRQLGTSSRYLIHPVILSTLSADRVEALRERFEALASVEDSSNLDETEGEGDDA